MKSIIDFDLINNEVFYRGWHILDYIAHHKDLPSLEEESIKATIVDALVYKGLMDPTTQSLDFRTLSIVDDTKHFTYQEHPNVTSIPLWMKEKFRTKCVKIIGGIPISMRIASPPSSIHRCVYDPNTAVSSIFPDATFINVIYDSPTRIGYRLEETRPFVEVEINGEKYLVDVLTKRIFKSSWFKETYNMEIKSSYTISELDAEAKAEYDDDVSDDKTLSHALESLSIFPKIEHPSFAEYNYEWDLTKVTFPEAWEEAERYIEERENFFKNKDNIKGFSFMKKMTSNEE